MTQAPRWSTTANALGCGGLLVVAAALSFVTYDLLATTLPELRLGLAIGAAILFTLSISSFVSLAFGFGRGERSRAAVVRRARSVEAPADGAPMLATGVVRPLTSPLTAPFSGTPCVSYRYRLYTFASRALSARPSGVAPRRRGGLLGLRVASVRPRRSLETGARRRRATARLSGVRAGWG